MKLQLLLLCFVVVITSYNDASTELSVSVAYNNSAMCIASKALPARFGPQLPAAGQTEYLLKVISNSSCAIEKPSAPRNISKTDIALLQGCNRSVFVEILRAQQAGHRITFVCKVDPEQRVTVMVGDKETKQLIKISLHFTGRLVTLHVQRTPQCKTMVRRVLPQKDYLDFILEKEILFIAYKILTAFSIMVGMSWFRRACKLKLHVYKQGDKYETCVVCLEDYQEGDHLKILPCSHAYHGTCIDTWFHTQSWEKTCPTCKQVVNT